MLSYPFHVLAREYGNKQVEFFTVSTVKNETFIRSLHKDFTLVQALNKIRKNNEKLMYTYEDMYKLVEELEKMDITKDKSKWSIYGCDSLKELSIFDRYQIQLGVIILPPSENDYWE